MMCRPDGMVFDDGVTLRLAEDRYFMTTTTGGAAGVLDWLEEWHQTEWPELDVFLHLGHRAVDDDRCRRAEVPRRDRQSRPATGPSACRTTAFGS